MKTLSAVRLKFSCRGLWSCELVEAPTTSSGRNLVGSLSTSKRKNHCARITACQAVWMRLARIMCARVAVEQYNLSYYIGETPFFTMYISTQYGNLISVP